MQLSPSPLLLLLACVAGAGAAERVTVGSGGIQGDDDSLLADLSDDGRYAVFASEADNLLPSGPGRGIYVRDRATGTTALEVLLPSGWVSLTEGGHQTRISGDGRWIATLGIDAGLASTDGFVHIMVCDRTGIAVDVEDRNAAGVLANASSRRPALSADGRWLAWDSTATNLTLPEGYLPARSDVFLRNRVTGAVQCLSHDYEGYPDTGTSLCLALSGSGLITVLWSDAPGLLGPDPQPPGVYIRYTVGGTIERCDVRPGGGAPAVSAPPDADTDLNGRFVAFTSASPDLVPGDSNGVADIFIYDRLTRAVERISVGAGGAQANGASDRPAIDASGRFVAFRSEASNLVAGDTNGLPDVFVRDRVLRTTQRMSTGPFGAQLNDLLFPRVVISGDGRIAGWSTPSARMMVRDYNDAYDGFVNPIATLFRFRDPPFIVRWITALLLTVPPAPPQTNG